MDKTDISMFEILESGLSFGLIHPQRSLKFKESGYLNLTARLTYFLFTHISTLKGSIKSFFAKFHNWAEKKIGIHSLVILCLLGKIEAILCWQE